VCVSLSVCICVCVCVFLYISYFKDQQIPVSFIRVSFICLCSAHSLVVTASKIAKNLIRL